jgi:hypothetical protein
VVLRGSRDGVNWDDLVDLGSITGIPGARATVDDPPPFVGVRLTPDAPALWSGQILAWISLSSKLGFVEEESVAEPAMPDAMVEAIEGLLAPMRADLDPTSQPKTPYPLFPDPFAPASAT